MNRKHDEDENVWKELMDMFSQPNCIGEVRMLAVNPRTGVKLVYAFEPEATEIIDDDVEETIFELGPKNLYLSCRYSDLLRIGKRRYLMGDAVIYRLNREDDYTDMSSEEMAQACKELFGRMQSVRTGGFCFPVIDLNDDNKEDADDEKE